VLCYYVVNVFSCTQARISFLQGERKGQENLKTDLVRRIKMLELALRQERLKFWRELHPGQEPPDETIPEDGVFHICIYNTSFYFIFVRSRLASHAYGCRRRCKSTK
jgi:hypothetical protein